MPTGVTCKHTLAFMKQANIHYLYVIKNANPIGFITQKHLNETDELIDTKIQKLPTICKDIHTLKEVMSHMLLNNCDIVPIVNYQGDYVGTLRYNDIHEHIMEFYQLEEAN